MNKTQAQSHFVARANTSHTIRHTAPHSTRQWMAFSCCVPCAWFFRHSSNGHRRDRMTAASKRNGEIYRSQIDEHVWCGLFWKWLLRTNETASAALLPKIFLNAFGNVSVMALPKITLDVSVIQYICNPVALSVGIQSNQHRKLCTSHERTDCTTARSMSQFNSMWNREFCVRVAFDWIYFSDEHLIIGFSVQHITLSRAHTHTRTHLNQMPTSILRQKKTNWLPNNWRWLHRAINAGKHIWVCGSCMRHAEIESIASSNELKDDSLPSLLLSFTAYSNPIRFNIDSLMKIFN